MKLGAMSEVDLFDDHEVVVRMLQEFEALDQGVGAQGFIRKMKEMQWIMCRCGRMSEPKEKWRYLVATFQQEVGRIRDLKQAQLEAIQDKRSEAIRELEAFDRKLQLLQRAQEIEQGETNLKVYQGLLPGEAYEALRARIQEAFLEKVKAVLSQ